jgi:hypothetical protein
MHLTVQLAVHLAVHLAVQLAVHLAVYLAVQLAVHLAVHLTVQLAVHLAVHLAVYLAVHLTVQLAVHLAVHLAVAEATGLVPFPEVAPLLLMFAGAALVLRSVSSELQSTCLPMLVPGELPSGYRITVRLGINRGSLGLAHDRFSRRSSKLDRRLMSSDSPASAISL